MNIINESGLYNVILRSDKPEAKPFRKWITSEVLPSIRKYGAYMTPETLQAAILNPDTMIKLCQQLKAEQDKNAKLRIQNSTLSVELEVARPAKEYFDELVSRNLLTSFRETAQQLEIKEKVFISFLLEKKYIYRDKSGKLMPYTRKTTAYLKLRNASMKKQNGAERKRLSRRKAVRHSVYCT